MSKKPTYEELEQQVLELKESDLNRKRTEEELKKSEAFLNQSQKISHIGSYVTDLKTGVWQISKEMYKILGIDKTYPHTLQGFIAFVHPDSLEDFLTYHYKVESERLPFDYEYKIIRVNDKSERWIHGLGTIEYDEKSNPVRRVGTIQDITERKQTENEVKQTSENLRTIFDSVPNMLVLVNDQGRSEMVNNKGAAFSERAKEDLVGLLGGDVLNCLNSFTKDGCGRNPECSDCPVRTRVMSTFETGKSHIEEEGKMTFLRAGQKDTIDLLITTVPLNFSNEGKVLLSITDVTERQQAKEKLKAERDLMKQIMEISPAGITRVDGKGKIAYANQRAQEILGIRFDEDEKRSFNDPEWKITDFFGNPFPQERLPFNIAKKTGKSVYGIQHAIEWPDDRRAFLSINSSPLVNEKGKFDGIVSSIEDITDKYKTETKYKMLFDEMIDGFALHEIICDDSGKPIDYRFLEINPAFEHMTGLKSDSLIGRTVLDVMPQTELYWIEKYGKVVLTGEPDTFENYSQELDRYFHVTAFRYAKHQFACIFVDITKNKLAEAERTRLIEAINQAGEAIVITDSGGNIQYTNPTFEIITGYAREEVLDKNPKFLKSGFQNTSFYKELWDTILSGNRWTGELVNKRKTGELYTSECSISPVKDGTGQVTNFIWIAKDISKQKDLEKRINQAQKLESIGSLAGGIAHDFNNILFPIIGMSELMMEDLSPDSVEYENAQEIYHAGKRAKDLVNQILSFSRQTEKEMMPVKFQNVLKEVLKLCRATIPTNIEIEQEIQQDCGSIWANATQLHQIGMNLITNAYHALQDQNGKIAIELKEIVIERGDIDSSSVSPGKYALLSVTDNGTGMSNEIKSKIFDPYFTTKEKGKGTGLGLAVVYGIVKEYGGDIKVYTEVGLGTVFNVYLPLMEKTSDPKSRDLRNDIQTGDEHIFLVDDEPSIARLVQLMLERLGYTVTVRLSSIEALEAFKEKPDKFDMVISDMSMPHMTGDQLAFEIKKIVPDMPIIICSGFSERINKDKAEEIGVNGFLMKPVIKSDMAQMVRKVLDEK